MRLSDKEAPDATLLLPHLQDPDARLSWCAIADRISLEAMPYDCDVAGDRYRLNEIDLNTDLPFTSASTNSAFVWTRPSEWP
jgi:hypothetical protein